MTTINLPKESPKINLMSTVERKTMDLDSYLKIEPVPFQRFTEGRAATPKVKKALSKLRPEHLNVELVELTSDSYYHGKTYPAGSIFIINGNTRKHFWSNNLSDKVPEFVHATVYKFSTMEQIRDSYNTFDSPSAVERNQEKLYGILVRIHGFEPSCEKLIKGQVISALNLACHYYDSVIYNQPSVTPDAMDGQAALFIEELKVFDTIAKHPKHWDQALTCVALMALKVYGTTNQRLLDCLSLIDRRAMNTTVAERDGATHIVYEWDKNDKFKNKTTTWDKEGGLKQTTSFALYWINRYMENKNQIQLGYNWAETGSTFFATYHKKMPVSNLLTIAP